MEYLWNLVGEGEEHGRRRQRLDRHAAACDLVRILLDQQQLTNRMKRTGHPEYICFLREEKRLLRTDEKTLFLCTFGE